MQFSYEHIKERFLAARILIKNNIPKDKIQNKICLDVGCGIGNLLLAFSEAGAKKCVGIDTNLKEFGDNHIDKLSDEFNILLHNIEFIESSLQSLNYESSFDVVTCLDTIEHVQEPRSLIEQMYRALKPNGLCIIDTSPLYFSPIGSHLWPFLPRETSPWAHLYKNFDKNNSKKEIDEWHWKHFVELNKLTHLQLESYINQAGFKITGFYDNIKGKEDYPKFKDKIDHDLVPSLEDLFIEWNHYQLTK